MSVKILHCADIHLDTVFSGLSSSDEAEIRRDDLRKTFASIVETAKKENVDMMIISGDLFDAENISRHTAMYIKSKLSEIEDIPVYICAGNHDPKTAESFYGSLDFGKNIHIFDTEMECIEAEDYDIYGVSFDDFYAKESYLDGFSVKDKDKINIAVMHGDFNSENYNLITKTQMEESGIDYLALGHIHKHEIIKTKSCIAVYPGCPEGRGFDETGRKGIVISEVSKECSDVCFLPVCKREYHEIITDITDAQSYDDILSIIKNENGDLIKKDLYKIVLKGSEKFDVNTAVLSEYIDVFSLKIKKNTTAAIDMEEISSEFTLKGLFIKKALENIEKNNGDELSSLVLKMGLDALESTVK